MLHTLRKAVILSGCLCILLLYKYYLVYILSYKIISGWFASIVWDSTHPSEPRGSPSPFPAASVWHCQRYVPEASMDDKCCCGNTTNRSNNRNACKANIWTSLWCPGTPAVAANNQCIRCEKNQLNHACDTSVLMSHKWWCKAHSDTALLYIENFA